MLGTRRRNGQPFLIYLMAIALCLQTLEREREAAFMAELRRPEFGPGDVIELKLAVPENKRRVTVFKVRAAQWAGGWWVLWQGGLSA